MILFSYKKIRFLFLSVLTGILLSLPWLIAGSGYILFFAFIPLLFLENYYYLNFGNRNSIQVLIYGIISFGIWNILTTWWIGKATIIGFISAIIINTFLISVVFYIFHVLSANFKKVRYILFIVFWLCFEFIYFKTEISWPWLTLGYGLANNIKIIQWYEFTGILGGSVWILILNVLIFKIINYSSSTDLINRIIIKALLSLFILIIPMIYSNYQFKSYQEKGNSYEIAILQPNIDPYLSSSDLKISRLQLFSDMLKKTITDSTNFILGPEAYIKKSIFENKIQFDTSVKYLQNIIEQYKSFEIICGVKSHYIYSDSIDISLTAKRYHNSKLYIDRYNTLIHLSKRNINKRHKSKLVLGIEKTPYPGRLTVLEKISERMGGISQSLGIDKNQIIFNSQYCQLKIAAFVCYESVYGEFVAQFIKKGAQIIFLSTNDGWWGNTPGHKQHLSYSRVRAIETRRSIARSANTGISCFINQKGEIIKLLGFEKQGVIIDNLIPNSKITFYVKHGDYLGRICMIMSIYFLLYVVILYISKIFNIK